MVLDRGAYVIDTPFRQENRVMQRRSFLRGTAGAAATAVLPAPAVFAQLARTRMLRVIPLTSFYSLDTVFNTSLVTTNRHTVWHHPRS
jgi:TAT (twin-arginine translocation) pathway signal sequence